MSGEFLQRLLQRLRQEPAVLDVRVAGEPAGSGEADRVDLHVSAGPGLAPGLPAWTRTLPGCVYSGSEPHGWTLISGDGVEWRLHLQPAGGASGLADGRLHPAGDSPSSGWSEEDLPALAGDFWRDLYRAARAIRQARPLTAHRWLFACGGRLIDLYRAALAPGSAGRGWEGAEEVPGLLSALERVRSALGAPLDVRDQRRAAHRLATAFEALVLPLCERLGVAYPMDLRNLAFAQLDAAAGGEAQPGNSDPQA
jgi:hypothetical protein